MAVIAIDFDGTLVNGDQPIEGAREAVNLLREMGHKVFIHSCNNPRWIQKVLDNNDIRYDYIYEGGNGAKLIADLYVDDRGFHFRGDWPTEVLEILSRVSE